MRVTNLMMTNNALHNLQKQENRLNKLDQQYTSQKKISSPSEDPIVAARALKLNTTYSEVGQYVDKNIPDASAWLKMTQSALDNVSSILANASEKCVQANADGLGDTDRVAIATALSEMSEQIYQEGTSSYAGRYLFTGYKTDTNLIFTKKEENLKYKITEELSMDDISKKSTVVNEVAHESTQAGKVPVKEDFYRIRLAYADLDTVTVDNTNDGQDAATPSVSIYNNDTEKEMKITKSFDTYNEFIEDYETNELDDNDIVYIADKGEIILGKSVKDTLEHTKSFSVTYQKTGFENGELRPEHYFTCTQTDTSTGKVVEFKQTKQEIKYLVNYNQQLAVNVEAKNCFSHDIGRDVAELVDIVNDAVAANEKKKEYEEKLGSCVEGSAEYEKYKDLVEVATTEYELKNKIMQTAFSESETKFKQYGVTFSNQGTDVGTRQQRLDLILNRLKDQQADVEELQSENIDVDLTDIIVRFTSAYDVYQAALSATGKSITQTLLDYL